MTNATKAIIITLVNSGMALAVAFGLSLSNEKQAAVLGFVNALMAAAVLLTYKQSPKRIADA
jgi:hypothetical protein